MSSDRKSDTVFEEIVELVRNHPGNPDTLYVNDDKYAELIRSRDFEVRGIGGNLSQNDACVAGMDVYPINEWEVDMMALDTSEWPKAENYRNV